MSAYASALQNAISTATKKLQQEQAQLSATFSVEKNKSAVSWESLLASTTLAEKNILYDIRLSAESASNVQVMATAVVGLAADCGGIYNMIMAADYGTQINSLAKDMYDLIQKAAYSAEQASKLAMDSSASAAELSYSTLLELLKTNPGKDKMAELKTGFAERQQQASDAAGKANKLTEQITTMSSQLVDAYVAVHSLETLLIRTKATNPLISDELIRLATTAYTDAGNAFELDLVAVTSAIAACSAAMESETIAVWLNDQAGQVN